MPDPPPDPAQPAPKTSLPAKRPRGKKPRTQAEPPPETTAPAAKGKKNSQNPASLPARRNKKRELPKFTPAPYQAETTSGETPAVRAELPEPRGPHNPPKFRPPSPSDEATDATDVHVAPDATGTTDPAATTFPDDIASPLTPPLSARLPDSPSPDRLFETGTPTPPPRPVKHRLGSNRRPEFKPQETVESDPEVTEDWGGRSQEASTGPRRGRRLALGAFLISAPLIAYAVWHSLGRPGTATPDTPAPIERTVFSDPAEESRQAGEVVKRFLASATLDERAAFVRHPETTRPRMEAWYSDSHPLTPLSVLSFDDRTSEQTINGVTFLVLIMETDDRYQRAVALEKRPDGSYLVDWESFVFWSETRWPEFLSKEPAATHEFRVRVSLDTYFNFAYNDPKQWFCYKLIDPEDWAHCWGYCPIDSDAGVKLNRMIRRQRQHGEDVIKVILKLRFEESGKGRNQVLIEDVVEDGWIKAAP
jgi:hypothetical protein